MQRGASSLLLQALSGMQRVQKVGGSDELAEFMGTAAPAPAPAPAPSPSKPKQQRVNEPWVELTKAEKNRLAAEKRRQQREAVAAPAPDIVAARVTRGRRAEPAPGTLCNCAATVHGLVSAGRQTWNHKLLTRKLHYCLLFTAHQLPALW